MEGAGQRSTDETVARRLFDFSTARKWVKEDVALVDAVGYRRSDQYLASDLETEEYGCVNSEVMKIVA